MNEELLYHGEYTVLALETIAIKQISIFHYVNSQQQNSILRSLIKYSLLELSSSFLSLSRICTERKIADLYAQI